MNIIGESDLDVDIIHPKLHLRPFCMLAGVGRVFSSKASRHRPWSFVISFVSFSVLRSVFTTSSHVFLGLPLPQVPAT